MLYLHHILCMEPISFFAMESKCNYPLWENIPPSTVRATTWLSATQWHSAKCRSQKSEIWHNLTRCLTVTCSSAAIHLAKCTDWSLIQVTSRTDYNLDSQSLVNGKGSLAVQKVELEWHIIVINAKLCEQNYTITIHGMHHTSKGTNLYFTPIICAIKS